LSLLIVCMLNLYQIPPLLNILASAARLFGSPGIKAKSACIFVGSHFPELVSVSRGEWTLGLVPRKVVGSTLKERSAKASNCCCSNNHSH